MCEITLEVEVSGVDKRGAVGASMLGGSGGFLGNDHGHETFSSCVLDPSLLGGNAKRGFRNVSSDMSLVKVSRSNPAFSSHYLIRRLMHECSETSGVKQFERTFNKCTISRSVVLQTVCNHLRKLWQSFIAGNRGNRHNNHSSTSVESSLWAAHFHATLDLWRPGIVEL